jgi:dihydroxyacid dehydratase/phosphogluconate dehydratase
MLRPNLRSAVRSLVRTGDRIRLDVEERTLDVVLDDSELARRRDAWTPPPRKDARGYRRLYEDHVLQANEGCDLDFLRGRSAVVSDAVTYL